MKLLRNALLSLMFGTGLIFSGCATQQAEAPAPETTSATTESAAPAESAEESATAAHAPASTPAPVEQSPEAAKKDLLQVEPVKESAPETARTEEPAKMPVKEPAREPAPETTKPMESSPEGAVLGKVVLVNPKQNFVVIHFSKAIPPLQSVLTIYRDRVAVGTVRITTPINPPHASADVVSGAIKRGDLVR
jgi:hypothetical protein